MVACSFPIPYRDPELIRLIVAALYQPGHITTYAISKARGHLLLNTISDCGSMDEVLGKLRYFGMWHEAAILEGTALLETSKASLARVLTIVDANYPLGWFSLAGRAPLCAYISGPAEVLSMPTLGIVGSRHISPKVAAFGRQLSSEAGRLGYAVVSGGASGSDTAAMVGAKGPFIEILPHGLGGHLKATVSITLNPPGSPFSSLSAVLRNPLIYALGPTVVLQAAFKEGGSWNGATEALRLRLGRVFVREDASSPGQVALRNLGAGALSSSKGLEAALASAPLQPALSCER